VSWWDQLVTWAEAHPNLSGWAQGAAAVLAILVAIIAPMVQHWMERKSTAEAERRQTKSLRARLTASVRFEIHEALRSLEARHEAIEATIQQYVIARANNQPFPDAALPARPLAVSDPTIYRAVADHIGEFPAGVLERVVGLYNYLAELDSLSGSTFSQIDYIQSERSSLPRARMLAGWAIAVLDKFRDADFADDANVTIPPQQ